MKCNKQLVYLGIKFDGHCQEFRESYTFVKPTILYLPNDLILTIQHISMCEIKINIKNACDNKININKTLMLNGCDKVVLNIKKNCKCFSLSIKLCDIKTLKPCC